MKAFFYVLRRFKTANLLNLLGLTVAFAAFYVFMTQVQYARQYNRGLYDHENLYRLEIGRNMGGEVNWMITHIPQLADRLTEIPHVESIYVQEYEKNFETLKDGIPMTIHTNALKPGSLECLHAEAIEGRINLQAPDQCVIPASFARTFFGTTQAVGKTITLEGEKRQLEVIGVIKDFPENSSIPPSIFTYLGDVDGTEFGNPLYNYSYMVFVRLHPEANPEEVGELVGKLSFEVNRPLWHPEGKEENESQKTYFSQNMFFRLVPVADTYLSGVSDYSDKGDPGMLLVLSVACLLVLLVAGINFANFTLAQTPSRIRGINTRKVLGATNFLLRHQLVAEGVVVACTACLLAIGLCYLLSQMPEVNALVQGSLALGKHLNLLVLMLNIAVLLGVLATLYPAYYATSFPPALVLKGSFGLSPRGKALRQLLVGVQLTVAIVMVCYIGVLFLQSHYILRSDYGFEKDRLLTSNIGVYKPEVRSALRQELLKIPGVENACYSGYLPGVTDYLNNMVFRTDEFEIGYAECAVDCDFIDTYGIKLVEGRDFNEHDTESYIVTRLMRSNMPGVELEKEFMPGKAKKVVGVCENVHALSMRRDNASENIAFYVYGPGKQEFKSLDYLSVRCAKKADMTALKQSIQQTIDRVLETHDAEVSFLSEEMRQNYKEEFQFIDQVKVFSLICFIITLIGVFCLTLFETEYRRKEIGIRRVMGARIRQILALFSRRYVWLIILSFLVGAPVSYYLGEQWLMNFAEHTPIYWWLFPLALLVVSFITLATVLIQSWRVANDNPINSIKTE